mmetsp:Transcript_10111/g.22472  ORF Transcript_10111/g.22472 Transcript_10111/m.22472 type:complete len:275 (+) Transcript_10111:1479-2303(+)
MVLQFLDVLLQDYLHFMKIFGLLWAQVTGDLGRSKLLQHLGDPLRLLEGRGGTAVFAHEGRGLHRDRLGHSTGVGATEALGVPTKDVQIDGGAIRHGESSTAGLQGARDLQNDDDPSHMQGAGDQRQRPGRPRRDRLVAGPEPHAPVVVADHRQVHRQGQHQGPQEDGQVHQASLAFHHEEVQLVQDAASKGCSGTTEPASGGVLRRLGPSFRLRHEEGDGVVGTHQQKLLRRDGQADARVGVEAGVAALHLAEHPEMVVLRSTFARSSIGRSQ